MAAQASIVGVHAVEADEPVHLIELLVTGNVEDFDLAEVTQEDGGLPRRSWQAPYDDRVIEASASLTRYAFFFHHLDLSKPLLTRAGALMLPQATTTPAHLQDMVYESP